MHFQYTYIIYRSKRLQQMIKTSIIPKQFIKNKEELSQFQCMLCYELTVDVIRCKGPCHKSFCMKCVSRSKTKKNICPSRCSKPFVTQPISELKIQFRCPYKEDECAQPILSLDDFWKHCKSCKFISEKAKIEMGDKSNYQCKCGKILLFLTDDIAEKIFGISSDDELFEKFMNNFCGHCGEQTLCTAMCEPCSTEQRKYMYCSQCRPPPCTRIRCPIGHYLQIDRDFDYDLTCDLCGVSALLYKIKAYCDDECNFDICSQCWKKLPLEHPLIPLNNTIEKQQALHGQESDSSEGSDD